MASSMSKSKLISVLLLFVLLVAACTPPHRVSQEVYTHEPTWLMLTWQRDPTTTITVDWHTSGEIRADTLTYRKKGEADWSREPATSFPFPFSTRMIHRVELTDLTPATVYEFKLGQDGRVFTFRTMPPTLQDSIRFVVGGDVMHRKEWMEKTNRRAADYDPDFIVWGGDLAYADGQEENLYRWYKFLDAMKNTLVRPDGRVIPVLVAIGNHEMRGGYYHRREDAEDSDEFRSRVSPYFYALFAMPGQPGYNVLDFGDYMSILLLDSGHNNPVGGKQTEWLDSILTARAHIPHIYPVYHVPAYPSVRSFNNVVSTQIREHWVPLFEEHDIRVVFENHDHIYKRTVPLRKGKTDPGGIVYVGDGAWGVRTRHPRGLLRLGRPAWYLDVTASERHFIVVTLCATEKRVRAVSSTGKLIDEFTLGH